jgi:hypothetical protein
LHISHIFFNGLNNIVDISLVNNDVGYPGLIKNGSLDTNQKLKQINIIVKNIKITASENSVLSKGSEKEPEPGWICQAYFGYNFE